MNGLLGACWGTPAPDSGACSEKTTLCQAFMSFILPTFLEHRRSHAQSLCVDTAPSRARAEYAREKPEAQTTPTLGNDS